MWWFRVFLFWVKLRAKMLEAQVVICLYYRHWRVCHRDRQLSHWRQLHEHQRIVLLHLSYGILWRWSHLCRYVFFFHLIVLLKYNFNVKTIQPHLCNEYSMKRTYIEGGLSEIVSCQDLNVGWKCLAPALRSLAWGPAFYSTELSSSLNPPSFPTDYWL